ncbi:MAG: hypothetical protein AAGG02_14030, partial [Cyanobacteria bacterium P01_H01_bin.15]
GNDPIDQKFYQQSQDLANPKTAKTEFPFEPTAARFSLGVSGNVSSLQKTTAFAGINVDYNKQWSEEDIFVDALVAFSYDDGRDINTFRPISFTTAVYRSFLNKDWSLFGASVIAVNDNLFSSKNDDEDLTVLGEFFGGAGLNIWRGETPRNFLDLLLGIGPRYEYDFVDFAERNNRVSPSVVLFLYSRGYEIGIFNIDQIIGVSQAINDLDNLTASFDNRINIPIDDSWALNNRIFFRYRNDFVDESLPKLEFFFSTGLKYSF